MKFETKLNKILAMPDSDKKLTEIEKLGLSLGVFNKEPIIEEMHRLRGLGYENLAFKWLAKR